jgi:ARG/rhodanese/phosphatase superfamily protein
MQGSTNRPVKRHARRKILAGLAILAAASLSAAVLGLLPPTEVTVSAGGASGWRLGEPVTYENLTIFPVVSADSADTRGFETLDEALASGDAVVRESGHSGMHRSRDYDPGIEDQEYNEGAQVNQLVLVYHGKRPLLLLAGELLSGGKQDRIIGKDRIVPVGAGPLPLDVFCVEHGRWSDSDQFTASSIIVHPSVRERAAVDQEQGGVWDAVRSGSTAPESHGVAGAAPEAAPPAFSQQRIENEISTNAPTESYDKIYNSPNSGVPVSSFADEAQRRFEKATSGIKDGSVVGVVVAYGGEVAWSDVFASPSLFQRYWPKLLRSYVVEALSRPETREHATLDDAQDFLQHLDGRVKTESEPGVYRWTEITKGEYVEISLESLQPVQLKLHWLKIHRTS